jgi:acetyl esterase
MTDNVPVRIYIPINHDLTEASPVMFYYHGGGYVSGQLDNYDAICKEFSREINIVVISVG